METLNITEKRSRQSLPNTEYGLTSTEVNAIVSKINDIIDVVDDLTNTTEILDKKVGVNENQIFTSNEKRQARININSLVNAKLVGLLTIESLDNLTESGLYEGTLETTLNNTINLKLIVFSNLIETTGSIQIQYIETGKIYMRNLVDVENNTWSNWTWVGDDLSTYLSYQNPVSDFYKASFLNNLGVLADTAGYTFIGMATPTTVPTSVKNCFYLTTIPGYYVNFGEGGLQLQDSGLYMIKGTVTEPAFTWTSTLVMPSIVNITVSDAKTAANGGTLRPGRLYKIMGRPNDSGIIIQAATTTSFFTNGLRIGRVPYTYMKGSYGTVSGTPIMTSSIGVWVKNTTVFAGALTIWGGRLWEAKGNTNTLNATNTWTLNSTEWTLLNTSTNWYVDKIFNCTYDITQGTYGYVSRQWDNKGNSLGEAAVPSDGFLVEYNDWNLNAEGYCKFENNNLERLYNVIIDTEFGGGTYSILNNIGYGIIYNISLTNTASIIGNNFLLNGILPSKLYNSTIDNGSLYGNNIRGSIATCTLNSVYYSDLFAYNMFDITQGQIVKSHIDTNNYGSKNMNGNGIINAVIMNDDYSSETFSESKYTRDDLLPPFDNLIPMGSVSKQFSAVYSHIINTPNIKTNAAAPTDLYVTTGAEKTMVLDTVVWNDIIIHAANLRGGATVPPMAIFKNGIYGVLFENASTETVYGSFELPHGYKEGTDLHVHLHWSPESTNTGSCDFTFEYSITNVNAVFPTSTSMAISQAGSGVIGTHQLANAASVIVGTGKKIGDICVFALSRPTGDAFTGNAFVHSIGVHYQSDTIGSRQIATK